MLAAIVIGLFSVGCGSTVEGVPERASGQEGLFNPCTDIPDSVIEGVGLDPATESIDIFGVEQPGWKICAWDGSWYGLSILSTRYTTDDIRKNPDYVDIVDIEIDGRTAIEYRKVSDVVGEGCYVVFSADQGSVWVRVQSTGLEPQEMPSCDMARALADGLVSYLPI
ncbi:DUF3558 domain-containing protein [Rhodococcus sp. WS3]|uniref:DUF3558 domain-containing protein n=1 Tax=Rhodococcus sp. WS3 TaxID=2486271 RepID=UPI0011424C81|nr:DUF3558 domain-containing protein [Rhodococcus sp. WS3]